MRSARARRFGEVRQNGLEHLLANCVRDVPHRSAAGRLHEAPDVEPLVAVMAQCDGPLALGRPDPAQDGFQADPVLVHRPDFDDRVRMLLFLFSGSVLQFFLARRDPL